MPECKHFDFERLRSRKGTGRRFHMESVWPSHHRLVAESVQRSEEDQATTYGVVLSIMVDRILISLYAFGPEVCQTVASVDGWSGAAGCWFNLETAVHKMDIATSPKAAKTQQTCTRNFPQKESFFQQHFSTTPEGGMALWTNNWIKRDLFVLQWPPSGKRGRVKESKNSSPFDIPFVKHRSMLGLAGVPSGTHGSIQEQPGWCELVVVGVLCLFTPNGLNVTIIHNAVLSCSCRMRRV